ncbi:MAG: ATP-binding cassette domain-containing protein [Thermovirgaceae bacterium]
MSVLYELDSVKKLYDTRVVLQIGELQIRQGEIVGLVGPNGSGKSTLLRILALLEKPDEGMVRFCDEPARFEDNSQRRYVTMLLQNPFLLKRTVFENIAYGLRMRGTTSGLHKKVKTALEMVGLDPVHFTHRKWFQLSGGEAQRVAMASRLALKPKVILLDEPTASVDSASAHMIQKAVLRARDHWGSTLVVVTHDLPWIYGVAERILSLFRGKLIKDLPENILTGKWEPCGDGLSALSLSDGQYIIGAGTVGEESMALLDPEDIIICLEKPATDSALNSLRGTISEMTLENGSGQVLVKAKVAEKLLSSVVTGQSVEKLGLRPGIDVYLHFKASALKWMSHSS